MRQIIVEKSSMPTADEQMVEIVERKGQGHPDTIMDSVAERVAVELSKEYLKRFGRIYHFNADKGLLIAGDADVRFGGGKITEPARIIIGDRATLSVHGESFPASEIAERGARSWLKENLPKFSEHAVVEPALSQGSPELVGIFEKEGLLEANDTSASVGYYPLTDLEKTVLKTENLINSREFKKQFPETGTDVKVMGVRRKNKKSITIALAFISSEINSEQEYFKKKKEVTEKIAESVQGDTCIAVNTLDKPGKGIKGAYLTVTGTSAESGDSGQVGRGNGVNGLICLNRPSGSEAAAGKNPVSHIGKIYNVLSHVLAKEICEKVSGVDSAYVWMITRIGSRIDQPLVSARIKSNKGFDHKEVEEIVNQRLDKIRGFCSELAIGKYNVC